LLFIQEAAWFVADEAIQILGGMGYMRVSRQLVMEGELNQDIFTHLLIKVISRYLNLSDSTLLLFFIIILIKKSVCYCRIISLKKD